MFIYNYTDHSIDNVYERNCLKLESATIEQQVPHVHGSKKR